MRSRDKALIVMASVLAALVVGVGAALAHGSGGYRAPHAGASGKQLHGAQRMDSSRLSQVAYLTGLAEIDDHGDDDAGDPDAKGSANLLQVDERTVCYGFMIRGAETPTEVHIHKGLPGRTDRSSSPSTTRRRTRPVPRPAIQAPRQAARKSRRKRKWKHCAGSARTLPTTTSTSTARTFLKVLYGASSPSRTCQAAWLLADVER